MAAVRVRRPAYNWDESPDALLLRLHMPGVASEDDVDVHWSEEGSIECASTTWRLTGQLAYRVASCSWTVADGVLALTLHKHAPRVWDRVFLTELDEDDVDVHLRRERGLASAGPLPGRIAGGRALLRRWRSRMRTPLGYTRQLLHASDGLDWAMLAAVVAVVLLCSAPPDSAPVASMLARGPVAVAPAALPLVAVALFALPLRLLLALDAVSAARLVTGAAVVASLKLFRVECGRGHASPVWLRAFGALTCTPALLALAARATPVGGGALVASLLMGKFWLAERFTRMAWIGVAGALLGDARASVAVLVVLGGDAAMRGRLRVRWLLWCVALFVPLTAALAGVVPDALLYGPQHWRVLLWPGAWRAYTPLSAADIGAGVAAALPYAPLVALGAVLRPTLRRAAIVATLLAAVPGVGAHALPLAGAVAAGALEAAWAARRNGVRGLLALLAALGGALVALALPLWRAAAHPCAALA